MKLKISLISSFLHESDNFTLENNKFIKAIENRIQTKFEIVPLDDYDCDLKLIFIESGGSEGIFLEAFKNLQAPYYLLTSGANNSLAASLEILTYLNNNHLKGEVIHGSLDYSSKRILNLANNENLEQKRLGVVGKPSDWLISSIPEYKEIKNKFNYELVDIPISLLEQYYNEVKISDFNQNIKLDFNEEELKKAKKVYVAIKKIKNEFKLDGLTIRCFDLLSSIKSTSCLALGLLNKEGIIGTCEGDIMSMVTMELIKSITGQSSFQCNPSIIDVQNNEIVLAHCTVPFDMLEKYHLLTHFESNSGVAIKGFLKKDDVTIVRISSNLKDYFISEGKIVENLEESNLCRTQIKIKMDDVSSLLTKPCGNHHIVVYGKHKDKLKQVLDKLLK